MTFRMLLAYVVVVFIAVSMLAVSCVRADAGQIEDADRNPSRVWLSYAEPIPSVRFPNRHYFEMNDGSTYIHVTYGSCARADLVSNRTCKSVFWYAR